MNIGSNRDGRYAGKPKVVEIVGPAGAGKTTLYRALACHSESVRLENFPDVHKVADAPFFVTNGLRLLPGLLRLHQPGSRQITRREFAWMSILMGWAALLQKQSNSSNKAIILDQGPIYLMAEIRLFGPTCFRQTPAERLWQDLFARWSIALDMVFWLDAADDVLLDRIRSRQQEHIVKTESASAVFEFLNRYRTEYEVLLSTLTGLNASLRVFRFDTGQGQTVDILDQLLTELHR